ncbi:tlh3 [Fusarium beomiforme]|uniref:DNA 3'-5' helicase n=1 Tax=Fusarium beomiforme TaxID=44412 RepID=A0A9P5ACK8_9HYPO|nr:tlh3 [Fusarium beomiforme]
MGEIAASEEVEDEADLAYLSGMSNHSFRTFNYTYAGSTTLTVTSSLHRAYRASQSWRSLFRIDQVLQGKRPPAVSDTQAQGLLNACKKVRFRARPAAKEDGIIAAARRLHNDPELQLRRPGQRDAMLATMGPRAPEQVIVVLATGSGKTLVFMVGATLAGAETTILILPTVALRGNMLERLGKVALKHHIWRPGSKKSAPIVVVSAEAACTEEFLEYANRLSDRQCLDRIVIDECHLTITASCYRRSMSQLAWHVRQIRTQTVWLTATLPPIYQELFFEHNKLVRPHIVRESTNRPNIRYIVQQEPGLGNLYLFKSERDRVIIYCPTKDLVATSALGPGFDYPHIRLVIHVDAPSLLTDFSQESGRAGRDGEVAESIILLSAAWQPQLGRPVAADKEAMQLYLLQEYCSRGVLSQFLDSKPDWRWCMEGDELCSVCPEHHAQCRPPTLEFHLPRPVRDETEAGQDRDNGSGDVAVSEMIFTGPTEVIRQDRVRNEELSRYERDLETMKGCCLYCRVEGKSFEHTVTACARRFDWIRAKQKALRDCQSKKKEWMDRHAVCWKCYQPQEICRAADPEYEGDNSCQYPDMVMPLCFGAFSRPGRTQWFLKHFNESFKICQEYMLWLGKGASLGGSRCVNANCVAALLLGEFE